MRHIAHEGRCVVISAAQVQPSPDVLRVAAPGWPFDQPLMSGGSMIVGPLGDVLAGQVENSTVLLTAEFSPPTTSSEPATILMWWVTTRGRTSSA